MRRRLLPICVLIALAALPVEGAMAQGNNSPPTASFSWTPSLPVTGQNVTFTSTSSDPDGIESQRWALDADGAFNDSTQPSATRSFAKAGTYSVKLEVTDKKGATNAVTRSITVANRRPSACFTRSPVSPDSGQQVILDSACSSDPDGSIARVTWDLNGDNTFGDADDRGTRDARTAAITYTTSGPRTVRLRVVDDNSGSHTTALTVNVANKGPSSAFNYSPTAPRAGDTVTLRSTATDADGTIATHAWDLDADGSYDDATGATVSWRPAAARSYTIGLRVVDNFGAAAVSEQAIAVAARPRPLPRPTTPGGPGSGFDNPGPALPPRPVAPTLRLLDPFPVVRMRGRTTRRGAKLSLFSVRGPHGAVAQVRCRGRACPAKRLRKKIRTKSKRGARTVRFKRLERLLRSGTELRVTVTRQGMVGKFTRIRIRRMKLPVRVDRCVIPGSRLPAACPEAP